MHKYQSPDLTNLASVSSSKHFKQLFLVNCLQFNFQKMEHFRIQIFCILSNLTIITIMFHKINWTLLLFISLLGHALACGQGELPFQNNKCSSASYVEGCMDFASSGKCKTCQFNYDLLNGRCNYNPQPLQKCCLNFGGNGECSKCQPGLVLDGGACKQATIVGCLAKNGTKCINCADGFILNNNRCSQGIKKCASYNTDGSCSTCKNGFFPSYGICVPSSIPNCISEQNGVCTKCLTPFVLSDGKCQIANCQKPGQFGCLQCVSSFYVTDQGICAPFDIGCQEYKHGICIKCIPNFILNNGICKMQGCATYNSNNTCKSCINSFQLQSNGICKIPNCQKYIDNKCVICSSGYHLVGGSCKAISSNCVDFVGEVCHTCAQGYFLGQDGKCAIQEPGCSKYVKGICTECKSPFIITSSGKCIIDGCDKFDSSGCLLCKMPYIISGKVCRIPNCEQSSNGICTVCSQGYHLYNRQCVVDDLYCQGYDINGNCKGCLTNYHLSVQNVCVINTPGCIYTNGVCTSCLAQFTLFNGACKIQNCKIYNMFGCVECESNSYLSTSGMCLIKQVGCIYGGGKLTGCIPPFTLNSLLNKCEIQGCTSVVSTGCITCMVPYKLTQNICKIDNCLKSNNGQCIQCQDSYKPLNGICSRSISNCIQYNLNGCQTCANSFYLNARGDACIQVQPGCVYINGVCAKCADPFIFSNNTCIIEGCLSFDQTGCKTCKSAFTLDSGRCTLPNCKSLANGVCSSCDDGFQLSNGICKAADKCVELSLNGTCKTCSKGYSPNICGRCVPTVDNCAFYGKNGKCNECINMYFLTTSNLCQLRQKGCKSYVMGVCTQCISNYFLYSGICYPYTEGCLKYQGKDCVSCSNGYSLSNGICLKASSKLTKGLAFSDDFFTSPTTSNLNLSTSVDIDFNSVSAKNPACGSKIGTLFYSSVFNSSYYSFGINSTFGWRAAKATVGQWAGIQLSSAQTFYELQIQSGDNDAFVSQVSIEYSVDGVKFDQVPGVFNTSCGGSKIVSVQFVPVYAIAIRFIVKNYNLWPSARFDFIYNNIEEKQNNAGLFSTNQINTKIYAIQSSRLSNQLDINIRRFFNPARDCSQKQKCWSGIQLCEPKNVTAINFPTTSNTVGAITEFYIDYSLDGNYFSCYQNCTTIQVSGTKYTFKSALKAKNVRVHPTKWSGNPEVQFTFDYN